MKWKGYGPEHNSWVEENDAEYVLIHVGILSQELNRAFFHLGEHEILLTSFGQRKKRRINRKALLLSPASPGLATRPRLSLQAKSVRRQKKI